MMKIEWQFADKEVSREEIEAVSKKIGYKFPLDYILCSMVNNGANVEPEVFDVGQSKGCLVLSCHLMSQVQTIF